jgi:hypothetical protein
MSLFRSIHGVRTPVRVPAVAVSVVVEKEETDNVRGQAEASNNHDQLRMGDFLGLDKSLYGFEEDGEAEGDEEDSVDECTEGFGTLPLNLC